MKTTASNKQSQNLGRMMKRSEAGCCIGPTCADHLDKREVSRSKTFLIWVNHTSDTRQ